MSQQIEIPLDDDDYDSLTLHQDEGQQCFDFNLLRLDGSNSSLATTTSSNKRRSPSDSATLFTAPVMNPKKPKKVLFQDHNPQHTNNANPSNYCNGFSKISLHGTSQPEDQPRMQTLPQSLNSVASLRRCVSDPSDSEYLLEPGAGSGVNLVPQSPPESAKNVTGNVVVTPASKGIASLPPRAAALRRTVSDPSPKARSSSSNDMGVDDSPNYEKLRKLKSYMKEMNEWMEEVLPDQVPSEDEHANDNVMECESEKDTEEAVSVERVGNCLIIHFRCPCGKGYQILLTGSSCYYKLV